MSLYPIRLFGASILTEKKKMIHQKYVLHMGNKYDTNGKLKSAMGRILCTMARKSSPSYLFDKWERRFNKGIEMEGSYIEK